MIRRALTLLLFALLVAGAFPLLSEEETAPADAAEARPNLGWPREFTGEDYRLVVYQPQIRSWDDYLRMEAYAAVMLTAPGAEEGVAGAVKLVAKTDTHMDTRTVFIHDLELAEIRIPEIDGTSPERVREIVRSTFPEKPIAVSLDRVLAGISKSEVQGRKVELNDKPPAIFVSTKPAVLVNVNGDPAWIPSGVDDLSYAANTNWDLFQYEKGKTTLYLRKETGWLTAPALQGPWSAAKKLPKAFKKLPMNDNFRQVRIHVPGTKISPKNVPAVFVSTAPAELIVIEGEPKLVPVPDTPVLFVENTEVDLFRHIDDGHYYYLVAGRWFKNDDLEGDWSAATGKLPDGFADIPEDHAKGAVLASVPGTPQAEEAILQAQIPTVAVVSREDAPKEVKVEYVGDPEFRDIEGTELAYAINTASDVIRVGDDSYYLCQKGVWFLAAAPTGPWTVAPEVPKEIYSIPSESPVHHTTYVYAYDSTPETVVYGYTPGYMGVYVSWGCVVWGTGYYYSPYYYYDPFYYPYPIYYSYPYTYGAGAWYNPSTGFYGRGYAYYGPYGGAGFGASYNPTTGTYARGGYAYGAGGGSAYGAAFNPRTGVGAAGYRSYDAYGSWGQGVVSRGDQWLKSGYYSDARGSVRGFRDSSGRAGGVVDTGDGRAGFVRGKDDLYVGRDGDVYRRGDDGWYKHGGKGGGWDKVSDGLSPEQRDAVRDRAGSGLSDAQRDAVRDRAGSRGSSDVIRDLNRSQSGRQRGNVNSGRYDNWRSQGGYSSGSRGRSMGGGRMGGGRLGGRRGG